MKSTKLTEITETRVKRSTRVEALCLKSSEIQQSSKQSSMRANNPTYGRIFSSLFKLTY